MRIGSIIRTTFLATSAFLATSCERGPLHKVSLPTEMAYKIDSLKGVTQKILKDTSFQLFGRDTVLIFKKTLKNKPSDIIDEINFSAMLSTPQKDTGAVTTFIPVNVGNITLLTSTTNDISASNMKNAKAVIEDGVFSNKSEKSVYIPVGYYGQKKP